MIPTNMEKKEIRMILNKIYDVGHDLMNLGGDSFSVQSGEVLIDLHSDLEEHLQRFGLR